MSTPNTSASGGYLLPTTSQLLPGSLTLNQFIQSLIVGITGLSGSLVRPRFQQNPPKQPDIDINWIAFRVTSVNPDTYAYIGGIPTNQQLIRHEDVQVDVATYGPNSYEVIASLSDGIQIPQNLEALNEANMGFTNTTPILNMPDLVNERWVDKYEMNVMLRREVQRSYPILTFLSASVILYSAAASGEQISITAEATAP